MSVTRARRRRVIELEAAPRDVQMAIHPRFTQKQSMFESERSPLDSWE